MAGWYPRNVDHARIDFIVREVRSGRTFRSVGQDLGISRQRVQAIFSQATGGELVGKNRNRRSKYLWTPEAERLLGTMSDRVLAEKLGTTIGIVTTKRMRLKISSLQRSGLPRRNRIGETNDRLTIEGWERAGDDFWYLCRCQCGNTSRVRTSNFNKTRSCGCLQREHCSRLGKSRKKILATP